MDNRINLLFFVCVPKIIRQIKCTIQLVDERIIKSHISYRNEKLKTIINVPYLFYYFHLEKKVRERLRRSLICSVKYTIAIRLNYLL